MKADKLILPSLAVAAFLGSCSGPVKNPDSSPPPPNIIFILADDMGYGDLGVLFQNQRAGKNDRSEPWEFSPNLDRLASQGVLLTQQYCAAPVCAPSRASIMLGVSQGHANVRDNQFDKALEDNYTMASTLQKAGYSTAAIGKWGLQGDDRWDANGSSWPAHPLKRGFDYYLGYMRHVDGHEHYPVEGLYRGPREVWEDTVNIAAGLQKCYTADLWTAAAKRWIIQHENGKDAAKPFFMYLAYDTPHAVLELPTQNYPAGGGLNGGMQWLGEKGKMITTATGTPDSWIHPDYANATWDEDKDPSTPEVPWPEVFKRYATATRRIDDATGDILQLLKDLHIEDNTIIVFTSDNGPSRESYLPENYRDNTPDFFNSFGPFDGIKRDCWEGGVRMPAIAWWPGHIMEGKEITTPCASYDWAPTFLEAAGLPAPARMDGVSILPDLSGREGKKDRIVYIEYFEGGRTPEYPEFSPLHRGRKREQMQMIRTGTMVGVRYDVQSATDDFEIYDVSTDPQEIHNLAGKPEGDSLEKWMKNAVLQRRMPNASAPRTYDDAVIPAVEDRKTEKGIVWKEYDGEFPWVPGVSTLKELATGIADMPDAEVGKSKGDHALLFEGYLDIPMAGKYTFYLSADKGAVMRIHDATIIDADHGYKPGEEVEGTMNLAAGLHPFSIIYRGNAAEEPFINVLWSTETMNRMGVHDRAWRHSAQ